LRFYADWCNQVRKEDKPMVDLDYHHWRYFGIGLSNLAIDQGNEQKE
jgi:hypothetical protein